MAAQTDMPVRLVNCDGKLGTRCRFRFGSVLLRETCGMNRKPHRAAQIASEPYSRPYLGQHHNTPLLCNVALLDSKPPLPVRKASKPESQHQSSGETPGENVSAPSSRLAASPDECLRLLSRSRCPSGP